MAIIIQTENITNPGEEPVNGDKIKQTFAGGSSRTITFTSVNVVIESPAIRNISVGSFLDRLDIDGKLSIIYLHSEQGRLSGTLEGIQLYTQIENIKVRAFIDLDTPVLRPTINSLGLYTEEEMDTIFADGIPSELPAIGI